MPSAFAISVGHAVLTNLGDGSITLHNDDRPLECVTAIICLAMLNAGVAVIFGNWRLCYPRQRRVFAVGMALLSGLWLLQAALAVTPLLWSLRVAIDQLEHGNSALCPPLLVGPFMWFYLQVQVRMIRVYRSRFHPRLLGG